MEEGQSTREATTQGELALDEEQIQASAVGILRLDKYRSMDKNRSDWQ